MNEQWQELKETIIELRDSNGTGTQQEVCKFLANYMDILEKQMQEPCEDEYVKVPKKALKYRTAGMVAYNAEWLRNHFDIERAVICGAQEPCEDAISRQEAIDIVEFECGEWSGLAKTIAEEIKQLPSAQPEQQWIPCSEQLPPEENKTYWVCTDNGHQHECRWTNSNPIWTHLTTDWHWNIFDIPQYTKVVAWMELPKPYDGGEQDG